MRGRDSHFIPFDCVTAGRVNNTFLFRQPSAYDLRIIDLLKFDSVNIEFLRFSGGSVTTKGCGAESQSSNSITGQFTDFEITFVPLTIYKINFMSTFPPVFVGYF